MPSVEYPLNHGWLIIYSMPFKEPVLCLGFFSSKPFIRDLTSFEVVQLLGNCGSEFMMAKKISYFFGAKKGEWP